MPDSIAGLALELEALPPVEQRRILAALTEEERTALAAGMTVAAGVNASNEVYSRFSPWLATRIAEASGDGAGNTMTRAAREALADGVEAICAPAVTASRQPPAASGKSLYDAVGGFLSTRRARR